MPNYYKINNVDISSYYNNVNYNYFYDYKINLDRYKINSLSNLSYYYVPEINSIKVDPWNEVYLVNDKYIQSDIDEDQ